MAFIGKGVLTLNVPFKQIKEFNITSATKPFKALSFGYWEGLNELFDDLF